MVGLVCVLCGGVAWAMVRAGAGDEGERFYNRFRSVPSAELLARGNGFLDNEQPDSAYLSYSMVAARFQEGMPRAEKELTVKACNNAAVVAYYNFNDYSAALSHIVNAREISERYHLDGLLSHIYLLTAMIYDEEGSPTRMHAMLRKAMSAAKASGDWETALIAYHNRYSTYAPVPEGQRDSVSRDIRMLDGYAIPDTMPLLANVRHLRDANLALLAGRDDEAIRHVRLADSADNGAILGPERGHFSALTFIADIEARRGNTDKAIRLLEQVRSASRGVEADYYAQTCERLADLYARRGKEAEADRCRIAALETRDSLLSRQRNSMVRDTEDTYLRVHHMTARMRQAQQEKAALGAALAVAVAFVAVVAALALMLVAKNRRLRESNRALYAQTVQSLDATKAPKTENEVSEMSAELWPRIEAALDDPVSVTDPAFSLPSLAKAVGSNTTYVSQAINEMSGGNFSSLLANARVKIACQRLRDRSNDRLTIESIGAECGFGSRNTFTIAFRKCTGLTPSEFRKQSKNEE